jgi:hypothetical protein
VRRFRHGRDTWLRHEIVAGLLEGIDGPILDVGGLPNRLADQLGGAEVVTANLAPPADVIFDGRRLPFDDRAYEAAASVDVLEHVAPDARLGHVLEVLRVARSRAVLCCPLAPPAGAMTERQLADWHERVSGVREAYLEEHADNGLPSEAEVRALSAQLPEEWEVDVHFNGDGQAELELFRLETLAHFRHRPADRLRYAWHRLRTPVDTKLRTEAGPHDTRVYLVCRRARGQPTPVVLPVITRST